MPLEHLPHVDEHDVDVAATAQQVWDAAFRLLGSRLAGRPPRLLAALLGCDPAGELRWDRQEPGSAVPGFRIVTVSPPRLLVIAGRHRFSHYGIVLRIEPHPHGARCRLESRAAFPGVRGRLYRAAVVGSGGHVVAVRGLLRRLAAEAEQRAAHEQPGRR